MYHSTYSQDVDIKIFNNRDGCHIPEVLCTHADSRQLLWVGGIDGITKFDGTQFTNYDTKEGLNDTYVYTISESRQGNLWVGTRRGISRFDGRRFTNFTYGASKVLQDPIKKIIQLSNGAIYGCSHDGLFAVDLKRRILRKILSIPIRDMEANPKDRVLYLATKKGLIRLKGGKADYLNSRQNIHTLTFHQQKLWYATHSGLNGLQKQSIHLSLAIPDNPTVLWQRNGRPLLIQRNGILLDASCSPARSIDIREEILNGEIIHAALDKQGNIWLCTSTGLVRVSRVDYALIPFPSQNQSPVTAIGMDASGNLLIGTLRGLFIKYNNSWKSFIPGKVSDDAFITCIKRIGKKTYVGTYSGNVFEFERGKFKPVIGSKGSQCVYDIGQDKNGHLWICRGSDVLQFKGGKVIHHQLGKGYTQKAVVRSNGEVWFANFSRLKIFKNGVFREIMSNHKHSGAYVGLSEDHNGQMWIGTYGNGIYAYQNGVRTHISKQNGLCDDYVSSLCFDQRKRILWVGTSNGISKIKLGNDSEVLSIDDFLNEPNSEHFTCVQNAVMTDEMGFTWFGVGQALYRFSPTEKRDYPSHSALRIRNILVNNQPLKPKATEIQDKWFNIPLNPPFTYNQKDISFQICHIDLSQKPDYQYSWKLEGYQNSWTPWQPHDQATFTNLPSGKYVFYARTKRKNGNVVYSPPYSFRITLPFYLSSGFAILVFVGLVVSFVFVNNKRMKKIRKRELGELDNRRKLAESELKALRAQMNPHFMFNSLNAIQDLILHKELDESGLLIADFSKLMRMILENSLQKKITLEREIEFLKLYLTFEQLRFGDHFQTELSMDEGIDDFNLFLPSMMIQPFVENAINHGLMHRNGNGKLTISFGTLLRENTLMLKCTIEDNGVGRKRADELRKQRNLPYESLSTNITKDRVELLNSIHGKDSVRICIMDLSGEVQTGTRVEIEIAQNFET
jgi:ligand-binding sensor domain-containing protein